MIACMTNIIFNKKIIYETNISLLIVIDLKEKKKFFKMTFNKELNIFTN